MSVVASMLFATFFPQFLFSQIYPVSFQQRVKNSKHIAIAKLAEKIPYWDALRHNIYTLNILDVTAYLKGNPFTEQMGLISLGGQVGNQFEISNPSVKLDFRGEFLVFFERDNRSIDNKSFRANHAEILQCVSYASVQGVLRFQNGKYRDILSEAPMTEAELISKIRAITGEMPQKPDGTEFRARTPSPWNGGGVRTVTGITDGTGSTPSGFVSGTIVTNNELIINGSGFGSTTGTLEYSNADDGGSTVISNAVSSDIVSWSDTQIRVKIPTAAGTGTVTVKTSGGASAGSSAITIDYSILNVESTFLNWASSTRNRVELLDRGGNGGYVFEYNNDQPTAGTSFSANSSAIAAFERALESWRCATFVNFDRNDAGTATDFANDDVDIVMFTSLSAGVLGVATSRFSGTGSSGTCDMASTLWFLDEVDVQFQLDSGLPTGKTWNFGPGASTSSNFDFESVALHELGHGHGLGHIIASGKVMNFSISNGSDLRTLSTEDINGGTHKVTHSTASNCITTPSPMTALTSGNCATLPVELTFFRASEQNGQVYLQWQTATEVENDFFSPQRSSTGLNFETIGNVKGAGTSFEFLNYSFLDAQPLRGDNYYRLKQTDYNGDFSYSDVEVVRIEAENPSLQIFPNPVNGGTLTLSFDSNSEGELSVDLLPLSGKRFFSNRYDIQKGVNLFEINLENLHKGIYFLKIETSGRKVFNKRFVKM